MLSKKVADTQKPSSELVYKRLFDCWFNSFGIFGFLGIINGGATRCLVEVTDPT